MITVESIDSRVSHKDMSFLRLAMKVAETSNCSRRHGAVVVRGGSVLAIGSNSSRNATLTEHCDIIKHSTVHAEIDALSRVKDARGATVYVARINASGHVLFSRPCDYCYNSMILIGIKRIVYTS